MKICNVTAATPSNEDLLPTLQVPLFSASLVFPQFNSTFINSYFLSTCLQQMTSINPMHTTWPAPNSIIAGEHIGAFSS